MTDANAILQGRIDNTLYVGGTTNTNFRSRWICGITIWTCNRIAMFTITWLYIRDRLCIAKLLLPITSSACLKSSLTNLKFYLKILFVVGKVWLRRNKRYSRWYLEWLPTTVDKITDWFKQYQVSNMELWISGVLEKGTITRLFVSAKGEGGMKVVLKPKAGRWITPCTTLVFENIEDHKRAGYETQVRRTIFWKYCNDFFKMQGENSLHRLSVKY